MDLDSHRLWQGKQEVPLRPKAWEVLHYLIGRPGLLVTREVLHREVWTDAIVSDDVLTKAITELRRALSDSARTPQFIETVHGLGFRFVADVKIDGAPGSGEPEPPATTSPPVELASPFVGRQSELEELHRCFRRAGRGERQVVFLTGEAGIGKSTLSEEFLRSKALEGPDVYALHGRCIQQHGQREPYMPVLEALERLLTAQRGAQLLPLFRRIAPRWHAQIPWLQSENEPARVPNTGLSEPPERMLREIGAFLESLAAQSTIVLLLEDLHWSDNATIDLLSFLAERRDPARLLIIGTYRPVEASIHDHPIREVNQTLRTHRRGIDLALDDLSVADVREYLTLRFGNEVRGLAPIIHRRTDGNPLFVVAMVEELIRRGQLAPTDGGWAIAVPDDRVDLAIPSDLREMVMAQFQRLSADERSILEAAAVTGVSFEPSTVARGLGRDIEDVEVMAEQMARSRLFLTAASRAADTEPGKAYDFFHALHQQVIYEQVADARRRRLHQSIGEALEISSGERLAEVAAELSTHFERSGDHLRAAKYFGTCASRAQQRLAPHEAIACAERALALLERVPDSPHRRKSELELRLLLGAPLHLTRGYNAPEVRANYERARALCEEVGEARQLFEVIHAVWYAQMVRGEIAGAEVSVGDLERIAERQPAAEFRLRAELAHGRTEFRQGHFGAAARVYSRFLDQIRDHPMEIRADRYGVDPDVLVYVQGALALWFLGYPDQALTQARNGLSLAEKRHQPLSIASALMYATLLHLRRGEAEAAGRLAARAAELAAMNELATFRPMSRFFVGAGLLMRGDAERSLREMLPALPEHQRNVGSLLCGVMLAYLGAAHGQLGQWEEGLRRIDEGLALNEASREHMYTAELWRLKGELLLGQAGITTRKRGAVAREAIGAAQQCFTRSLDIARSQDARSLELRSAMSLTRFAARFGHAAESRALLRSLYDAFTEGFETKDLQDANTLLGGARE